MILGHNWEGFVGESTPLATTWKSEDKNPLYRCKDVKFCCCSSLKQNIYDKSYIHSVFSIQSFHWRLQLQTRAWKNKFSLKWTTHSWCNGSAPPEGKFQPATVKEHPGTAYEMARNSWANMASPQASVSPQPTKLCPQQTTKFPSWCCFVFEPCSRGVLCTHINIQQKNPNFQTSNPTPTQLGKWTVFIPRTATFTYIHKVHTRIILGFLEKRTNTLKKTPALSSYKMQVGIEEKKPNSLHGV